MPTPRDWSLAKPLTGGPFDPMGVVKKEKTMGFNYPPVKFSKYAKGGNPSFYKTDGFRSQNNSPIYNNYQPNKLRNSQNQPTNGLNAVNSRSDESSISDR